MRHLDQKQIITGDFICVYGDVVSNIALDTALSAHRTRREKNKKSIMTMVLREAGDYHRTKSHTMRPAFVIDPQDGRCVHYEQMRPHQTPRLDIAEEVLKDHVEVEVREDLLDCGIDICTPEVLAQYTDNFDWQMPRRGFLYGILKDFETNQLMVHTHVTSDGYAARVKNLQAYDAVSRDIVGRWTYPLCPDVNMLPDQSFQLQKGNIYKEDGVVLARSSLVGRKSILGKATSVGEGSVINESLVGRRCVIGKRVKLNGACIWDDARIGDDTVIEKAIVANEASIGRNCQVQPGALVSYGVKIADGMTVKGSSRITKAKRQGSQHSAQEFPRTDADTKVVGQGGDGYELAIDEDEEEFLETLVPGDIYNLHDEALSAASISDLDSEDEDDESLDAESKRRSSRSESFASINSDESGDTRRRAADFHHEATASIVDALQKNEDADTIQLELQALKLSSNAEDKQVRRAVAVSLMKRTAGLVESGTSPKNAIDKVLLPNTLLVKRCVSTDKVSEQVEFLLYMQTDLVHRQQGEKILLFACNSLASVDLIEPEGFFQWWDDERSSATDELTRVRKDTKLVVDALRSGDDSDEDDDGDSESEDGSE
jgi:translation initiation factor eIF-2B subunit epsilon